MTPHCLRQFANILCEMWILQPQAAKSTSHTWMIAHVEHLAQAFTGRRLQNPHLTLGWARSPGELSFKIFTCQLFCLHNILCCNSCHISYLNGLLESLFPA